MATFSEDLVTKLNSSGIANITAYAESWPAPKNTTAQIVGIVSAGETFENNMARVSYTKRFTVSGSDTTAYSKAYEIFRYFIPETKRPVWLNNTGFETTNYTCFKVFPEKLPSMSRSSGNIFFCDFSLRFLASRI